MQDFDWALVSDQLLLTPEHSVAVVISACVIYAVFLFYIRIFGQRTLAGLSTFDALVTIMIGAIAGRVILGTAPTLMSGVIGLLSLLILEGIFGAMRSFTRGDRLLNVPAQVLMAGDQPLERRMRIARVTLAELHSVLRQAGVSHYGQVAAVILEPGGKISVLKRGEPIDPHLLHGVHGAEHVPAELLRRIEE
ncbi:DUF421 domain-containing protein [Micrococcoides hystricis]|uniref:DUF421 domain-containing protein n=1 Tax=Micrococcoides hystricis TaxID=1572761 RepID=A0ABV6P7Y1_9MICC